MAVGKKLSKSDDSERRAQENRLMEKVIDAMIAWCRAYQAKDPEAPEAHAKWRKISDEYKRQYDKD